MANKKEKLSEKDIQKQLATYKASYEMYEKSKIDTEDRRKNAVDKHGNRIYTDDSLEETLNLINTMQADVKDKYLELGGKEEDLYVSPKRGKNRGINRSKFEAIMQKEKEKMQEELDNNSEPFENAEYNTDVIAETEEIKPSIPMINELDITELVDKDVKPTQHVEPKFTEVKKVNETKIPDEPKVSDNVGIGSVNMDISKSIGNNIKYDVIPLPSKGKCYSHKIGKLPVAYLTAYDENMIMSPNLYQDGTFLDYMIKSKIMTTKIDTDDLIPGDREAILIWLRASGYGPLYPITAKDKNTGKEFKTTFDLSKLNYKPFNLDADENGNFEYTLPNTKDVIKFKFLSYKEIKEINKIAIREDSTLKKNKLIEMSESIQYYVENDSEMSADNKTKLNSALKNINEYVESIDVNDSLAFNHLVTNRLIRNIVSVNGVSDRKYIEEYVTYLNIKDATALKRYIDKNEPGVDMNIQVERPESLGGGSVDLFLTLDQYLFLDYIDEE